MDKILEVFTANNDELYVLHEPATNAFTQNEQTRRWKVNKKSYMKQKLILKVSKLKRKVCYFLWKNSTLNYSEKLKKSTNVNDKKLLKLIHVAENSIEQFNRSDNKIPIRSDYVEKIEIDRSTLLTVSFKLHTQTQ